MKGRLFSVTMFVLVLMLGLAVPALAAPRPPVVYVTSWSTPDAVPGEWTPSISGVSWKVKGARLLGYTFEYTTDGETWFSYGKSVSVDPAQRYPQNLSATLDTRLYVTGQGSPCQVAEYVLLYDASQDPPHLLARTDNFTSYCMSPTP